MSEGEGGRAIIPHQTRTECCNATTLASYMHLMYTRFHSHLMKWRAGAGSSQSVLEPVILLLEFMGALERNLYAAYDGSCLRASPPRPAATFFYQNRKVPPTISSPVQHTPTL